MKCVFSRVQGLRHERIGAAVVCSQGPWIPQIRRSRMFAQVLSLGSYTIVRKAGEQTFSLYRPGALLPEVTGSLQACRDVGERNWARDACQDLEPDGVRPDDCLVDDFGAIVLIRARTQLAREWLTANLPDGADWDGQSVLLERPFFSSVMRGIMQAGLRANY